MVKNNYLCTRNDIIIEMGRRIRKLKKQRIHSEGNDTLIFSLFIIVAIAVVLWRSFDTKIPFWCFVSVFAVIYGIVLNFFRCPIRFLDFDTDVYDPDKVVVAPADGRVVVVEEVQEDEYFHDRRLMISIFMSLFNVHANWFPVSGKVKMVKHQNGNYHKAWLPKASEENEHADVMIETADGTNVLCRQIAGAVARRIVTYAKEGEDCEIDDHLGFIKFGSRVDVYLPVNSEVFVKLGQATTGDQTIIAKLR